MPRRLASVIGLSLLAWLVATGPARAAASFSPAVGAATFASGSELHVFWQGSQGGISTAVRDLASGAWSGPQTIPGSAGTVAGAPTATTTRGDGQIDVFWPGRDGGVEESVYTRSGWSPGPTELPATAGTVGSALSASDWRAGDETVVVWRGTDGELDSEYFHASTGTWSTIVHPTGAIPSAGTISSAIAAGVVGGAELELFWMGSDGGIWETYFTDAGGWRDAYEVVPAGDAASAPAFAVAAGGSKIDLFYRGPSGEIDESVYTSGVKGFTSPAAVPGTPGAGVTSAPTAVEEDEANTTDVLWEQGDTITRTSYAPSSGWLPSPLQDVPMSSAPAVTPNPPVVGTSPVVVAPTHRRGRVSVQVKAAWRWSGPFTRLRALSMVRLGHSASVLLTCRGHGCPHRRWSARKGRVQRLERRLRGVRLRAGDRLILTIRMPNKRAERVRIEIRSGRRPAETLL